MLKENDRIACRFKDDKRYVEGYIKEISGKIQNQNFRSLKCLSKLLNSLVIIAEYLNLFFSTGQKIYVRLVAAYTLLAANAIN